MTEEHVVLHRPGWIGFLRTDYDGGFPGGALTSRTVANSEGTAVITVTTNLDDLGTVFTHWWQDGLYIGMTTDKRMSFYVQEGEQLEIQCIPTRYADWNASEWGPPFYSARRSAEWLGSADSDTAYYELQYATAVSPGADDWTVAARVTHDGRWAYRATTGRLPDETDVELRIVPYDTHGNAGTELNLGREIIASWPEVFDFTAAYSASTHRVTFAAA